MLSGMSDKTVVTIRMDTALLKIVDAEAKHNHRSRANLIEHTLSWYFLNTREQMLRQFKDGVPGKALTDKCISRLIADRR